MTKHSKSRLKGEAASQPRLGRITTIGVDVGDKYSEMCLLDGRGCVQGRMRVRTTPAAVGAYFGGLARTRVALEIGTHSPWMSRLLEQCGHDVIVANARELRKIHQSDRKNDRNDAEMLARLAQVDPSLLKPIRHRSAQKQADLAVIRARDVVVRTRAGYIHAARGLTKSFGARLPKCSAEAFVKRATTAIPEHLEPALAPLLKTIAECTATIRGYDRYLEHLMVERYPETQLPRQITGVGPVTALAFVLSLADKNRFAHSRDVGAYLGLVPKQYDSGDRRSQLHITKAGNAYVRRLLVQNAQYILGPGRPDCNLRRYGERLMQRGGKNAKHRAVIAVARKLAVLMHALWTTGAVYEPNYLPAMNDQAA